MDPGVDPDTGSSRYTTNTGFGTALFDACNAFGEISRYRMMHGIAHQWNPGSRFAMNRYRFHGIAYVRDNPGKDPIILHCKEGIPQRCGFSMFLYGFGMMPLPEKLEEAVPDPLLPSFVDDLGSA